jgi:hypothetical protein
MGEIVNRIRLQVEGADAATKEIRKMRDAYKEVSESAGSISSDVGTSDPFKKAIAPPSGGAALESHAREHRAALARSDDRLQRNKSQGRFGGVNGAVGAATGTMMQISGENAAGAAGSAFGSLARMIGMGTLMGAGFAAGSTVLNSIGALSSKEKERVQQLHGSGLSTRLGSSYSEVRNTTIKMGQNGIASQRATGLLQSLANSGGQFNASTWNSIAEAANIMEYFGLPPETVGQFIGQQQQSNLSSKYNKRIMATGMQTFGRGMANDFVSELNRIQSVQLSTVKDAAITSSAMMNNATLLANIKSAGGMTASGSIAVMQQAEAAGRGAANLSKPQDLVAYSLMKQANPDMSVTDIMMKMESQPFEVSKQMAEYFYKDSPNKDVARLRMRQFMGGNVSQSDAFMQAVEKGGGTISKQEAQKIISDSSVVAQEGMVNTAYDQAKLVETIENFAYQTSHLFTKLFGGGMGSYGGGLEGSEFGTTATAEEFGKGLKETTVVMSTRNIEAGTITAQNIVSMSAKSGNEQYASQYKAIFDTSLSKTPYGAAQMDPFYLNYGDVGVGLDVAGPSALFSTLLGNLAPEAYGEFTKQVKKSLSPLLGVREKDVDSSGDIMSASQKMFGKTVDTAEEQRLMIEILNKISESLNNTERILREQGNIVFADE